MPNIQSMEAIKKANAVRENNKTSILNHDEAYNEQRAQSIDQDLQRAGSSKKLIQFFENFQEINRHSRKNLYQHKHSKYNLPPPMNVTNGSSSLRIFAKHIYGKKYEHLNSAQQIELLERIVN